MKKDYLEVLRQKRAAQDKDDLTVLPHKKRGRPVLLGQELDATVQTYLRKVRGGGGAVSAWIVMAATQGILLAIDKSKLEEFGGNVRLKPILGTLPAETHELCPEESYHNQE